MELFLLSFFVIVLAALGMGVGAVFRGAELKGTCASLACEVCPARHLQGARNGGACPRRIASNGGSELSGTDMACR